MNTVYFRFWNNRTKLWYRDSIDEEDFSKALAHFYWYQEHCSEDEDIEDARVILKTEKGTTCCRYTKSNNPVW